MSQAQQASQQDCWVNELISFKPLWFGIIC
jgi:hypothetical protein